MWLRFKTFMTSAIVIGALVRVATWSLPAIRMGTSLREQLGGFLVRLPRDVAPPVGAASAGGER